MGGSSPYEKIKFENSARIFLKRQRQHEARTQQQQQQHQHRLYHFRLIADTTTTTTPKSALYFLSIVILSVYIFNLIYLGISINIAHHHHHHHPAGIASITSSSLSFSSSSSSSSSSAVALSSKDVTIDNEKEELSSIYQKKQQQQQQQKQYSQNQNNQKQINQELNFIPNNELNDRDYFSDSFLLSRKRFLELDRSRIKTVEAATMVASNNIKGHPYLHSKMFVDWTDFNVEHMSKYWNMLGILDSNDPNQLLNHMITTFYEPYIKRIIMDDNENTKPKTTIMSNTIAMIAFMPYSYNRRKSLFINKTPEGIQRGKILTSYSLAATIASLWSSGPFGRTVVVGLNESDQQYTIEACTILQKLSSSSALSSEDDSSSSSLFSIIVDNNNNNNNNRKSTLVDDNDESLPRTTVILSSSSSSSSNTVNSSIAEIVYTPGATYDNSKHNNDDGGGRGGNADYDNDNHDDVVVDQKNKVVVMDIAHIHVTDPTLYESKFMKFNVPRAAVVGMQQALLVGQNSNNTGHHHNEESLNWLGTRHIVNNNDSNNNNNNDNNNGEYWKYIVLIEPDTIMNINHNLLPKIKQALDGEESISLFPHRLHPLPHESDLPKNTTLNRGLYLPNVPELYVTTLMTDPTDSIGSTVTTAAAATATATTDDNDGPYISCCDDGGNYPIRKQGGGGAPSSPCPQKIINGQNSGGGSNKWYLCGFREIDNDNDNDDDYDDDDYNGGVDHGDGGGDNMHIQQKHMKHKHNKKPSSTITTNEQILKGHENILKYKMMRLKNGLGVVFGSSNQGRRCLPSKIPCPIT